MGALRSAFLQALKAAAKPYSDTGWSVRGVGLVHRGVDGSWGQVVFRGASTNENYPHKYIRIDPPQLFIRLIAGTCSPYLMRVVSKVDPLKPPPPDYVAADTVVRCDSAVTFSEIGAEDPPAMPPGVSGLKVRESVALYPATARAWLVEALAEVIPQTEALCSERAIRDWLAEGIPGPMADRSWDLRKAILLTRHLGLVDELPALIDRAEKAYLQRLAEYPLISGRDRQRLRLDEWSHERFMRYFREGDS